MPRLDEEYTSCYSENILNISNATNGPNNHIQFITTFGKDRNISQTTLSKKDAISLARNILDYYADILLEDLK